MPAEGKGHYHDVSVAPPVNKRLTLDESFARTKEDFFKKEQKAREAEGKSVMSKIINKKATIITEKSGDVRFRQYVGGKLVATDMVAKGGVVTILGKYMISQVIGSDGKTRENHGFLKVQLKGGREGYISANHLKISTDEAVKPISGPAKSPKSRPASEPTTKPATSPKSNPASEPKTTKEPASKPTPKTALIDTIPHVALEPDTKEIKTEEIPYGIWVPNRPGFVYSPFAEKNQLVDVAGIGPGVEVKCPYTDKLFKVPPELSNAGSGPADISGPTLVVPTSAPSDKPKPAPTAPKAPEKEKEWSGLSKDLLNLAEGEDIPPDPADYTGEFTSSIKTLNQKDKEYIGKMANVNQITLDKLTDADGLAIPGNVTRVSFDNLLNIKGVKIPKSVTHLSSIKIQDGINVGKDSGNGITHIDAIATWREVDKNKSQVYKGGKLIDETSTPAPAEKAERAENWSGLSPEFAKVISDGKGGIQKPEEKGALIGDELLSLTNTDKKYISMMKNAEEIMLTKLENASGIVLPSSVTALHLGIKNTDTLTLPNSVTSLNAINLKDGLKVGKDSPNKINSVYTKEMGWVDVSKDKPQIYKEGKLIDDPYAPVEPTEPATNTTPAAPAAAPAPAPAAEQEKPVESAEDWSGLSPEFAEAVKDANDKIRKPEVIDGELKLYCYGLNPKEQDFIGKMNKLESFSLPYLSYYTTGLIFPPNVQKVGLHSITSFGDKKLPQSVTYISATKLQDGLKVGIGSGNKIEKVCGNDGKFINVDPSKSQIYKLGKLEDITTVAQPAAAPAAAPVTPTAAPAPETAKPAESNETPGLDQRWEWDGSWLVGKHLENPSKGFTGSDKTYKNLTYKDISSINVDNDVIKELKTQADTMYKDLLSKQGKDLSPIKANNLKNLTIQQMHDQLNPKVDK